MKRKVGLRRRWMVNNLIYIALIIVVCVVVFSVFTMNYYYMNLQTTLTNGAKMSAEHFSGELTSDIDSFYTNAKRQLAGENHLYNVERQILLSNGKVVMSSSGLPAGGTPGTPDVSKAVEANDTKVYMGEDSLTGERVISVSSPLVSGDGQVIGLVRYVTSLREVDRRIIFQTILVSVIGFAMFFIVFISNKIFIRSIVSPLREVTDISKKIAEGNYGATIEKKYNDEIGELVDSINEMSAEIAKSDKIKNEFISSVSHELRTPLTAIIGWGETITAVGFENKEEAQRGMEIILKETRRLSKMVEELLDFARMESGRFTLYVDTMNLKAEFEETLFMYADIFKKANVETVYRQDDDDEIFINGDRERLKQVFFNMLDNAVKHGGDGGRIEITVKRDGKLAKISIRDFGQGISEEELPYVKLKFYKGKSKAQGNGIGLAVSDEIVNLHGGSLDISSKVGEGTEITISLPVKEMEV
ncbi:MAG: HAMP domain-containing protein [Oscillospiraceae bacterium]|nr:HAMP domain-containing protein [Oscillospiraceae bacterium]MBQ7120619.1 HAMP domain-containing protein [Oscillospiraceae bacterium]